jgi:hypothetical protein
MVPIDTFTMHTQPTLPHTTIICAPKGRAVITVSGPRIRHLYQLFRPDLAHRTFEEEVNHLITGLGKCSEVLSLTPATTTRNRLATSEDLLYALRNTFHTQTELYSDHLNKSLHSHTYHSLYLEASSSYPVVATPMILGTART